MTLPRLTSDPPATHGGPSYQQDDPNYLYDLLTHLSNVSDPNYKANVDAYNRLTGLDVNGRYQGYNAARYMMPLQYMVTARQLAQQLAYQPMQQQAMGQAIAQMANPSGMVDQFENRTRASNDRTYQNQMQIGRQQGLSTNALASLALANQNRTASQTNQFRGQNDSAQGRLANAQGINQLIAMMNPDYRQLGALHQLELSTPREQSGLEALSGLAGQALSGGISFKGGSNTNNIFS
jgi:hypothetical protein